MVISSMEVSLNGPHVNTVSFLNMLTSQDIMMVHRLFCKCMIVTFCMWSFGFSILAEHWISHRTYSPFPTNYFNGYLPFGFFPWQNRVSKSASLTSRMWSTSIFSHKDKTMQPKSSYGRFQFLWRPHWSSWFQGWTCCTAPNKSLDLMRLNTHCKRCSLYKSSNAFNRNG